MMNRVEFNEEMMEAVVGGNCIHRRITTKSYPKNEPAVEVEAVAVEVSAGVEASEDDHSFWSWLWS